MIGIGSPSIGPTDFARAQALSRNTEGLVLCSLFSASPVSHCITWFQTQPILTTCEIRYHSHCGIIAALDSSEP